MYDSSFQKEMSISTTRTLTRTLPTSPRLHYTWFKSLTLRCTHVECHKTFIDLPETQSTFHPVFKVSFKRMERHQWNAIPLRDITEGSFLQSHVTFARIWWKVDWAKWATWSTDKIDANFLEKSDEVNYRKPLHDRACSVADVFTQVFI